MKEIILNETTVLWGDGVGNYFVKFTIKGTGIQGRYTVERNSKDGELTNAEIVKMIQKEIYGKECVCGIDKGSEYRNIKMLSINTIWNHIGQETGIEVLFEMPDGKKKIKRIDFMDIVRESNKEYISDLEYSTGEDIRIVVKVDVEQMGKIDEIIKALDALKQNKRIDVVE